MPCKIAEVNTYSFDFTNSLPYNTKAIEYLSFFSNEVALIDNNQVEEADYLGAYVLFYNENYLEIILKKKRTLFTGRH